MTDPHVTLRRRRQVASPPSQEPRPARLSQTVLTVVMEIAHVNNAGNVHGGVIMRLVDTAAGIAAARHASRRVVTASMDEMSFLAPVYLGDLVHVAAAVNEAFRTSMEVGVRVDVEPVPRGARRHVASAYLVYVALDDNDQPAAVPPLVAETEAERRRKAQAHIRRQQRLLRKQALLGMAGDEFTSSG